MPTPEKQEKQKFRDRLEAEGKTEVWRKAGGGFYWRPRHTAWATEWLREQEKAEAAAVATSRREDYAALSAVVRCYRSSTRATRLPAATRELWPPCWQHVGDMRYKSCGRSTSR